MRMKVVLPLPFGPEEAEDLAASGPAGSIPFTTVFPCRSAS
jgi:hypothetical protein